MTTQHIVLLLGKGHRKRLPNSGPRTVPAPPIITIAMKSIE